jgi:hypothetical protein
MVTTKTETASKGSGVPAIYTSLAKVLEAMSVEKGGILPGNMGSKPYITAVDLSAEAKRQFVANNIVMIPNEKVIKHENLVSSRTTISIVIEGTYELVSTLDGSSAVISGVGDGLAIGTAVSSNIASTNALKNALLRAFLVTEQSVEEAAKNGVPDEPAQKPTGTSAATPTSIDVLKSEIGKIIADGNNSFDGPKVNQLGDKLTGSTPEKRAWKAADYKKILEGLRAKVEAEQKTGEVAEV